MSRTPCLLLHMSRTPCLVFDGGLPRLLTVVGFCIECSPPKSWVAVILAPATVQGMEGRSTLPELASALPDRDFKCTRLCTMPTPVALTRCVRLSIGRMHWVRSPWLPHGHCALFCPHCTGAALALCGWACAARLMPHRRSWGADGCVRACVPVRAASANEADPLSGDAERLNRHLEVAKLCVSAQVRSSKLTHMALRVSAALCECVCVSVSLSAHVHALACVCVRTSVRVRACMGVNMGVVHVCGRSPRSLVCVHAPTHCPPWKLTFVWLHQHVFVPVCLQAGRTRPPACAPPACRLPVRHLRPRAVCVCAPVCVRLRAVCVCAPVCVRLRAVCVCAPVCVCVCVLSA